MPYKGKKRAGKRVLNTWKEVCKIAWCGISEAKALELKLAYKRCREY